MRGKAWQTAGVSRENGSAKRRRRVHLKFVLYQGTASAVPKIFEGSAPASKLTHDRKSLASSQVPASTDDMSHILSGAGKMMLYYAQGE